MGTRLMGDDAVKLPAGGANRPEDLILVDPELAQTELPKLVLPPAEPPAQVRLPNVIVRSNEWQGSQCGVLEPRYAVFRHADKWQEFWEKGMAPYSPKLARVPDVDFSKDMVVGVFLGEEPTPTYQVRIRSLKLESPPGREKTLTVFYHVISTMQGVFVPPFKVQPFHLRKVPAFEGKVIFLKVRR